MNVIRIWEVNKWENGIEYTSGGKIAKFPQISEKYHWLHADPITLAISKEEKYKANVTNTIKMLNTNTKKEILNSTRGKKEKLHKGKII